jgi:hypothetical protein
MDSDHGKAQPVKLFEPADREELLRGWLLHAHKGRDRHDFAAIVGTSVFASLESTPNNSIKIVLGLASISSAVLASLQTFYDFASRAESHRMAGVKYKTVVRMLEQILTQPVKQLPEKSDFLDDLRKRLDDLEAEAPVVPEGIYRQVEERYASVVFSEKVASFVK